MLSRALMTTSAVFLIGSGAVLNFAPQEVAAQLGVSGGAMATLVFQVLAGLLMGMGIVNWMSRGNAVGGIYGRAIGLGNALQFVVGSFGFARAVVADSSPMLLVLLGAYLLFAVGFLYLVFFGNPVRVQGAC
jgi:hypothetical protein